MKDKIGFFILATVIAVVSLGTAGEVDEPLDNQALVLLEHNGLFIDPPTTANLVVMNMRVFDDDNQLVFSERSDGQPINLLAVDLPDGDYTYEIVSVLDISAGVESAPNVESEKDVRVNGRISVSQGEIIEGSLSGRSVLPLTPDEASINDRKPSPMLHLAGRVLEVLVPAVQADDLVIHSEFPKLTFDDSFSFDPNDFEISASATGAAGNFQIVDRLGDNGQPVIYISGVPGTIDNILSIDVDADGDIHWSNGSMHFIKNNGLGIWTQQINGDITIFSGAPDIHLHDNTGTQETEWGLSDDNAQFWGRPNDSADWKNIFSYNVNAPDHSLRVGDNGNVGMGLETPARQLHLKGSNAVFRMDRSTNSAAFMLVRTTGGGAPMKAFVVGTNASGTNNGEFIINDLGTAVSGGGNRRMTINNSGNVHFTGVVTASNIAAPSSRELKKNIEPIADSLELTQQLEGVRFDWKANDTSALGFIAEDLEEVLPEVVLHDEGSGEMLGVNYAAVVPVLVEAIKEQQRQMDVQRREIETLKKRQQEIEVMKAQIAALQTQELKLAYN